MAARRTYVQVFISLIAISMVLTVLYCQRSYYLDSLSAYYQPQLDVIHKERKLCDNFAKEVSKGSWRKRPGLTYNEYSERKNMDEKIRTRMKWPAKLYRNDSRCGKKNVIPGYRIQSLCDPEGSTPCCNAATGLCGISNNHCNCTECTDLRDFISADLVEWVAENPECGIKNFTTRDACDLLNKHKTNILFIGDSLIRHVVSTMLVLLSGDRMLGAMPARATHAQNEKCKGEFQLTDKDCSIYLSAHSTEDCKNGSICGGKVGFVVSSAQVYFASITEEAINKTKVLLGVKNTYLVLGVGMHFWLKVDLAKNNFLDVLLRLVEKSNNGWPKIIWIELHSVDGFLRVDTKFTNNNLERYNEEINKYAEGKNITVVRTFKMSKTLKSYDGQHYGMAFNLYKVQLLLNHIWQMTDD